MGNRHRPRTHTRRKNPSTERRQCPAFYKNVRIPNQAAQRGDFTRTHAQVKQNWRDSALRQVKIQQMRKCGRSPDDFANSYQMNGGSVLAADLGYRHRDDFCGSRLVILVLRDSMRWVAMLSGVTKHYGSALACCLSSVVIV